MHKTIARGRGVHRGAAAARRRRRRRRRGDLRRRSPRCGDGRLDARLARRGLRAEHAPGGPRARSPARSRRAMLSELDVHGVVLGHSERRELFGETDRALQLKVPAALDGRAASRSCASARPRRSASAATPSASCATRSRRTSTNVPDERLAEVVIAYEPIWAIGTGQVATPEQAQEAIAFVRALVGRPRRGARPSRCGSSTAARSSPTTRPSCWRCRTSTARSSAAPRWTPSRSRRSSRPPR